jgi:hypothetical protein
MSKEYPEEGAYSTALATEAVEEERPLDDQSPEDSEGPGEEVQWDGDEDKLEEFDEEEEGEEEEEDNDFLDEGYGDEDEDGDGSFGFF